MTKIALISDTHSLLEDDVIDHLVTHDEIWHAGDFGSMALVHKLESLGKKLRGVYGNIDDHEIRTIFPKDLKFSCEGLSIFMTHIGGYPERYTARVKQALLDDPYDIYICGHSHILKVIYDKKLDVLHMNPGACGRHGFHIYRTLLSFELDNGKILNTNVIQLGLRSKIN